MLGPCSLKEIATDRYVEAVPMFRHDKARSPLTGLKCTTSGLPIVTTTNYVKVKLDIRRRGWPVTYLRSEFHRFTPVTQSKVSALGGVRGGWGARTAT